MGCGKSVESSSTAKAEQQGANAQRPPGAPGKGDGVKTKKDAANTRAHEPAADEPPATGELSPGGGGSPTGGQGAFREPDDAADLPSGEPAAAETSTGVLNDAALASLRVKKESERQDQVSMIDRWKDTVVKPVIDGSGRPADEGLDPNRKHVLTMEALAGQRLVGGGGAS